jgi:hypothetical protein
MKKITFLVLIILNTLSSCKKKEDPAPAVQITQSISNSAIILRKGVFTGYEHNLSGKAFIVKDGNKHILRLSEYNMTSGPNVDVLLSKSASYSASNVVKISDLNGSYTNSAINFELSPSLTWADYPYVIVWCADFNVNFGTAHLINP